MRAAFLAAAALGATGLARAADRAGQWGAGGGLDLAAPLGSQAVWNVGGPGLGFGLWARRGLSAHWQGALSWEDAGLGGVRIEPLTFSAIYSFFPDRRIVATFEALEP